MAKNIMLKHEKLNIIKDGKIGFSWTTFFFGFFVPLFRGDYITALALVFASLIISFITYGVGSLIFNIILGFWYNKYYTTNLINEGFRPTNKSDEYLLNRYGIYFNPID